MLEKLTDLMNKLRKDRNSKDKDIKATVVLGDSVEAENVLEKKEENEEK